MGLIRPWRRYRGSPTHKWVWFWGEKADHLDPMQQVGRPAADVSEFDSLAKDAREALDLSPRDALLDVGVCNGLLSSRIYREVGRYAGCDYCLGQLEHAQRAMPDAALVVADLVTLPYPSGAFDKLLCAGVFHYLDGRRQDLAMAEIRRVLRPGGLAFVAGLADEGIGPRSHEAAWYARDLFVPWAAGHGFRAEVREISVGALTTYNYQFDVLMEVAE